MSEIYVSGIYLFGATLVRFFDRKLCSLSHSNSVKGLMSRCSNIKELQNNRHMFTLFVPIKNTQLDSAVKTNGKLRSIAMLGGLKLLLLS